MAGEALRFRDDEKSKAETEIQESVTVTIAAIGGVVESRKVAAGTTLGALLKEVKGYREQEVRIDGSVKPMSYVLKEGDLVSVLPRAVRGGTILASALQ